MHTRYTHAQFWIFIHLSDADGVYFEEHLDHMEVKRAGGHIRDAHPRPITYYSISNPQPILGQVGWHARHPAALASRQKVEQG